MFRFFINMEWLNYHHLQCFWLVARRGGLVPAAKVLHVSTSTVWAQLKAVEARLGVTLLQRRGRSLQLTEVGERVCRIADDIFSLGQSVLAATREPASQPPLRIGAVPSLPRLVARRVVSAALGTGSRVSVHHGPAVELLGALAAGQLEVVLTDEPPAKEPVRAHAHPIATSPLALFASPSLARTLKPKLPESLDGAPFLLPASGSAQRFAIDAALQKLKTRPRIGAEIDDSALLKSLASQGHGVIAAPELVADELKSLYGLTELCALKAHEAYFAVTRHQRLDSPEVVAMVGAFK